MTHRHQRLLEQDAFAKLPDNVLAHIAVFAVDNLPQIAQLSQRWAHICARNDVDEAKERWPAVRTRRRWLAAVQQSGRALQDAPAELRGDREFMLAAVQQNGRALEYASAELRGDREIVLAAVQQDGDALEYASAELQGDREFISAAVKR